jgi:putative glutamine amidotransferase
VIGICAAIESAKWAAWEVVVNLSPRTYSLAVQRAGGIAIILPPDDVVAESPDVLPAPWRSGWWAATTPR